MCLTFANFELRSAFGLRALPDYDKQLSLPGSSVRFLYSLYCLSLERLDREFFTTEQKRKASTPVIKSKGKRG
jgi:hypothetical protein